MTLQQVPSPTPYGVLGSTEQVVAGNVSTTTPTIDAGSGFTIAKTGTGNITFTFTTAFSSTPTIVAVAISPPSECRVVMSGTTGFSAQIFNSAGTATEGGINFIAYIPSAAKTRLPRDFGFVTTLPTSPTPQTGDICTFTDSLTAGTYTWELRYNASQVAANKWICTGGTPIRSEVDGQGNRTSATYGDCTSGVTTVPTVTVPLAGDYDIIHGCDIKNENISSLLDVFASFSIGGTAAVDADRCGSTSNQAFDGASVVAKRRKTGIAASTAFAQKYRASSASAMRVTYRFIEALPFRVG